MPYTGTPFAKNYVEVVPQAGDLCPDCGSVIKQGKFSPYCSTCKCFFIEQGGQGFRPAVSKDDIPIIREDTPTIKSEIIGVLEDVLEYLKKK